MSKPLIIIEGPGKIKKLQSIVGNNYKIMASGGHIIDLPPDKMSINIENDFEPIYQVISGKQDTINNLKNAYDNSSDIYLATDADREGEMIAWSLAYELGLQDPKRITFIGLTKKEVTEGLKKPGKINTNLVNAQKARRELDRIVGYEISPLLWGTLGSAKSAGRVQSVIVRLIVDRENEIKKFFEEESKSCFRFNAEFLDLNKKHFNAQLYETKKSENEDHDVEQDIDENENEKISGRQAKIPDEKSARTLMNLLIKSKYKVGDISSKQKIRNPSPPFTTSTMQQDGIRKLGMTVKRITNAAQNLYQEGHVTYIRTDSVNILKEPLEKIGEYIVNKFGEEYHRRKEYKSKSANTQEAHEAIRPTDPSVENIQHGGKIGSDEVRLYNLIWRRTIASQMAPAKINVKTVQIAISKTSDYYFVTRTHNVIFEGFLAIYNIDDSRSEENSVRGKKSKKNKNNNDKDNEDDEEETNKNIKLETGKFIEPQKITTNQEYKKPPTRYNEASLLARIDPDDMNIGRPATINSLISKIQEREYVKVSDMDGHEKQSLLMVWTVKDSDIIESNKLILLGKENNRLVPTDLGIKVTNFLVEHFPDIMDYKFTADMESKLDEIAEGNLKWTDVMHEFYEKFHPTVLKIKNKLNDIKQSNKAKEIYIGDHPATGHKIYTSSSKWGAMIKMYSPDGKCKIGSMPKSLTDKTIKIDDAVKVFEYPKILGKHNRKQITLKLGKNGTYINYNDTNIATKLDKDPTLEEAIEIIKDKFKNILFDKKDGKTQYTVLNGPYGIYVKILTSTGKMTNVKLSQDINTTDLTLDKIKEAIKVSRASRFKKKSQSLNEPAKSNEPIKEEDNETIKTIKTIKQPETSKSKEKKIVVKGKKNKTAKTNNTNKTNNNTNKTNKTNNNTKKSKKQEINLFNV